MSLDMLETMRHYIFGEASIFFLLCGKNGRILESNKFTKDLLGKDPEYMRLNDLIVDFHDLVDLRKLIKIGDKEHLLNIKTFTGLPESIYIKIYDLETNYLILGRKDVKEEATLRRDTIELNNELNTISRQLHKKNAELMQLNSNKEMYSLGTIRNLEGFVEKMLKSIQSLENELKNLNIPIDNFQDFKHIREYANKILGLIHYPLSKEKERENNKKS